MDNHIEVPVILLDIQDQLREQILLNYCYYIYLSQTILDLSISIYLLEETWTFHNHINCLGLSI